MGASGYGAYLFSGKLGFETQSDIFVTLTFIFCLLIGVNGILGILASIIFSKTGILLSWIVIFIDFLCALAFTIGGGIVVGVSGYATNFISWHETYDYMKYLYFCTAGYCVYHLIVASILNCRYRNYFFKIVDLSNDIEDKKKLPSNHSYELINQPIQHVSENHSLANSVFQEGKSSKNPSGILNPLNPVPLANNHSNLSSLTPKNHSTLQEKPNIFTPDELLKKDPNGLDSSPENTAEKKKRSKKPTKKKTLGDSEKSEPEKK